MTANALNVAVIDGKTITRATELRSNQQGKSIRIKAVANGKYVLAAGEDGAEGQHSITIVEKTTDGSTSAASPGFQFTIDITAPDQSVITEVLDNIGSLSADTILSGGITNHPRPGIGGTGEAGSTVTVYSNGDFLGTALVNSSGQWSLPLTADLPENLNSLTATATDLAGNLSPTSAAYSITVDTSSPVAMAIVESMSKDSGATPNTFITNDGSAGRMIYGSLSSALADGEKVQTSFDGGLTLIDATVSENKWSALDMSCHRADWQIHTRVLDLAGQTNHAFVAGETLSFSNFTLVASAVTSSGNGSTGFGSNLGNWADPAPSQALVMMGGSQVILNMNAGENVNLDDLLANGTEPGNWANSGRNVTLGGAVYEEYRHDRLDAELLVQQGVQTNLV